MNNTFVKADEALLLEVAMRFGFDAKQSSNLVKDVWHAANKVISGQHLDKFAMRLYLSKIMVAKCVFKISDRLFSQSNSQSSFDLSESSSSNITIQRLKNVPLSYLAAFILNKTSKFSIEEISDVLNISPSKVKERIKKAYSYMQ